MKDGEWGKLLVNALRRGTLLLYAKLGYTNWMGEYLRTDKLSRGR